MTMTAAEFPKTAGIYQLKMELENGNLFRYTLFIPGNVDGKKEIPLIMALHFGGQVTPWYSRGFMEVLPLPAFKDMGAIIAAPDCVYNGWDNPDSEKAVIRLTDVLKKNYPIDKNRIALTGFSMGGIGTWYLAQRNPHIFCAAIPLSSSINANALKLNRDMPVYIIHSTGDEIFPVKAVKEMAGKLKQQGIDVHLEIIEGISHYHTGRFVDALKKAAQWLRKKW